MIGFFQRRSIKIYSKHKKGFPALEAPVIDVKAQADQLRKPDTSGYGIDAVITLMRKLPQGDQDTIVSVLKHTLESVDVDIKHVIADADDKIVAINDHLLELHTEISRFREGIKARLEEISSLEADLAETLDAKEDLLYAEKITSTRSEEPIDPHFIKSESATETHAANSTQDELMGPEPEEKSFQASVTAPTTNVQDQSAHRENEEDDGIPVVEAIDLDQHKANFDENSADESFKDSIKKTKPKQGKAVSA